ncbi:MAG: Hsp70 family protein [Methylotenera sp.]|nr:Hsp70 family protein [Oligoflexia bacterium]
MTQQKHPGIKAIGIDFGTSNTAAAILTDAGEVKLLELDPTASDPRLMKSLIYFPNRKDAFFGKEAIDQYFDREMEGRFFQSVKKLLPNPDFQGTTIHNTRVSVEELVARFLRETKKRIEAQIGPMEGIPLFMGRPARYAQDPGREGLGVVRFKTACDLAGLGRFQLIEEPTAAAATYEARSNEKELMMVADLGGGTSDFTLLEITPERAGIKTRALSVHGISVAGDSLDSDFMLARLLPFFGSEVKYQRPFSGNVLTMPTSLVKVLPKWHHHAFLKERATWNFIQTLHKELVDPKQKPQLDNLITLIEENLGYALHQRVEKLKVELSGAAQADFSFKSHPIKIEFPVTAPDFENVLHPSVKAIQEAALETLRLARVNPEEVQSIYFTGGTSQVPIIRRTLSALTPQARIAEQDTFTSVAAGLAMTAQRE